MNNINVEINEGIAKVSTEHGSYSLPSRLWELFESCSEPVALTAFCAKAKAHGFSNSKVRATVQMLAQPGQYKGSACIGAINTSTVKNRAYIQVASEGAAEARAPLTRKEKAPAEETQQD